MRAAGIPGRATPAGTARHAERFASSFGAEFYRLLSSGFTVSSIGLGTYLGECDDEDDARYEATIRAALDAGINLLDSAINYRCQRSERAVGRALRTATREGGLARDGVVLCSKGGYIPLDGAAPPSREAYQAYVTREYVDTGIISPEDIVAGGHCLAPAFIANQLARSRENLGVQALDVYYLHNPEQQLDAVDRPTFRGRMRDAFALLEERVTRQEIGTYGCATWAGLRAPPRARGHLSLAELVEIAREVAGEEHHLRVVQLPVSLAMSEAVRAPTQRLPSGREVPLLHAAAELGISVVASAPLMQARLTTGLPAQLRDTFPALETDAQRALAFVHALPVAAALVGMRSVEHLRENLEVGRVPGA
jgi:aryl-alcohol dehydrogenase-like predicted oxidoreductase